MITYLPLMLQVSVPDRPHGVRGGGGADWGGHRRAAPPPVGGGRAQRRLRTHLRPRARKVPGERKTICVNDYEPNVVFKFNMVKTRTLE